MTPDVVATRIRRLYGLIVGVSESRRVAELMHDASIEQFEVEGRDIVTGLSRRVMVKREDLGPPDDHVGAVSR